MVITPAEARKLTKADEGVVQRVEEEIDEALRNNNLNISVGRFPNEKVREKIITMYRGAGWDVKYVSDQREGDYLSFKGGSGQR